MQNGSVVLEPFRWAHDPAVAFCRPCRDVLFNEDSNGVPLGSGGAKLAELGRKPDWVTPDCTHQCYLGRGHRDRLLGAHLIPRSLRSLLEST